MLRKNMKRGQDKNLVSNKKTCIWMNSNRVHHQKIFTIDLDPSEEKKKPLDDDDNLKKNLFKTATNTVEPIINYTSCHGFNVLSNMNKKSKRKFFWILVMTGCLAFLVQQTTKQIDFYKTKPISNRITKRIYSAMMFPKILICNNHRFLRSKLQQNPEMFNYLKNNGKVLRQVNRITQQISVGTFHRVVDKAERRFRQLILKPYAAQTETVSKNYTEIYLLVNLVMKALHNISQNHAEVDANLVLLRKLVWNKTNTANFEEDFIRGYNNSVEAWIDTSLTKYHPNLLDIVYFLQSKFMPLIVTYVGDLHNMVVDTFEAQDVMMKDIAPLEIVMETLPIFNDLMLTKMGNLLDSGDGSRKLGVSRMFNMSLFNIYRSASWSLYESLIYCRFAAMNCDMNEHMFKEVITTNGRCYQFNPDRNRPLQQYLSGEGFGLQMSLDIKTYDSDVLLNSLYSLTQYTNAIKIYISSPFDDAMDEPLLLQPGYHHNIDISLTRAINLDENHWGDCIKTKMRIVDLDYTPSLCLTECLLDTIEDACGCRPYYDPRVSLNETKHCVIQSDVVCAHITEQMNRGCPKCSAQACDSRSYEWRMTSAPVLLENMAEYFPNSTVSFNIQFSKMLATRFVQIQLTTIETLIGTFGGLCGLCLGISIVTMFEFIEYIILRITACF
ncbi:hypothetical protein SNEBB_007521 [Seison nebaliae]|nr:hypothetical protein SNEBB_007521 [Seison nebaliae]